MCVNAELGAAITRRATIRPEGIRSVCGQAIRAWRRLSRYAGRGRAFTALLRSMTVASETAMH